MQQAKVGLQQQSTRLPEWDKLWRSSFVHSMTAGPRALEA